MMVQQVPQAQLVPRETMGQSVPQAMMVQLAQPVHPAMRVRQEPPVQRDLQEMTGPLEIPVQLE